jgi:hypothetical protein
MDWVVGCKEKRPGRRTDRGAREGGCKPLIIWSLLAQRLRLER